MNYQSKTFKLFYRERLIGIIKNVTTDFPWFIAEIEVTDAFDQFKEIFEVLTDEDNENRFERADEIEHVNWFIEDDQGEKEEIILPAIHDGNEIWWRWGDPKVLMGKDEYEKSCWER